MKQFIKKTRLYLLLFIIFSIAFIGNVFASSNIIQVTNAVIKTTSSHVDASVDGFTSSEVDVSDKFYKVNEYIDYELTLKNIGSKQYSIASITNNNTNENIDYEYFDFKNKILSPNQTDTITIRKVYYKGISNPDQNSLNENVRFDFVLVDEDGITVYTDGENPATGDLFFRYLLLFILSCISVFLLSYLLKNKKILTVFSILACIGLVSIPYLARAASFTASVLFNESIQILDNVKVTFYIDEITKEEIIPYNTTVTPPEVGVKNGYIFQGWYLGNSLFDFSTKITSNIELVARWEKESYTITYDLDGSSSTGNPNTYSVTDLPIELVAPEKTGYNFVGWTGSNGDVPQTTVVIQNFTSDLSYTANFEPIEYDIDYAGVTPDELNSLGNPANYTIEDSVSLTNPTVRLDSDDEVYQRFVGWRDGDYSVSNSIQFSHETGDKAYTAIWIDVAPNVHTITYDLNNGSLSEENPNEFTKLSDSFTLNNPTRRGYEFVGWTGSNGDTPQTTVTIETGTNEDLHFTANFQIINYELTYDLAGGSASNDSTYTVIDTYTLVNPTKTGYNFIGWTGTDLTENTINVTIPVNSIGDRSYTAHYSVITYNITYTTGGGTIPGGLSNPEHYTIEDVITLNNPEKEGFAFVGWTGSNGDTPQETVTITHSTGDLNYTANYLAGSYAIRFYKNAEDATGTMADEVMTVDEGKALTKNTFTRNGYVFVEWTTEPDGTGTAYSDEEVVTNLALSGVFNLYAKWRTATKAVFDTGSNVNKKMKKLAGASNPGTGTSNSNITKILYSASVPEMYKTNDNKVSASSSTIPIYMWYDSTNKIIYYGSDADELYLNANAGYMFTYMTALTDIEMNFKTSDTTDMTQMFYKDTKVTSLDVSGFDTSKVTVMWSTFGECTKLTEIIGIKSWNVENVNDFHFMFNQCTEMVNLDLTGWNTKSAVNMRNMFSSMYKLESIDISTFNTSKAQNMQSMFDNDYLLTDLDLRNFDTSNVTNMMKMFLKDYALVNLDISSFNTSKVTTMEKMFQACSSMVTLDISNFDTSKVTTFSNMFDDMTSLTTIYVGDGFSRASLTSTPVMFANDENLVGGANTHWTSGQTKSSYACVDNPPTNPGYFTKKTS